MANCTLVVLGDDVTRSPVVEAERIVCRATDFLFAKFATGDVFLAFFSLSLPRRKNFRIQPEIENKNLLFLLA